MDLQTIKSKGALSVHFKGRVKRLIATLTIMVILVANVGFAAPAQSVGLQIEDKAVAFTQATGYPFVDANNRTLVPFRAAMEAFGAKVSWAATTQTATAVKGDITVVVTIGQASIVKNGHTIANDTKAVVKDGRTYLPIRAVLKAFDAYVNWNGFQQRVEVTSNPNKWPILELEMTTGEKMTLMLYPETAPATVANFLDLVSKGFYDGLTFHRVIEDFMIQGGDPLGNGTGSSSAKIIGEFTANGINNPIKHTEGVLSMARSSAPNSASCQFFIMHKPYPSLDGNYAAFGKVIEGLDVVNKLATVETGINDKPVKTLQIKSIKQLP